MAQTGRGLCHGAGGWCILRRMERPPKDRAPAGGLKDPRADRLAAALRENLKRRKAQARAQSATRPGPANEAAPDKAPSK
jgi:hypothetical protein